jgi:hypothetical protein
MKQNSVLAQLPEPLSESVRLVGILLIVQALLRLAFLAMTLLRVGLAYVNGFTFVTIITGIAGLVAGLLALQRYALARPFGLAFCAIGLLLQVYFVGNIIFMGYLLRVSPLNWLLTLVHIAVYAIGLGIFTLTQYYKAGSGFGSGAPTG